MDWPQIWESQHFWTARPCWSSCVRLLKCRIPRQSSQNTWQSLCIDLTCWPNEQRRDAVDRMSLHLAMIMCSTWFWDLFKCVLFCSWKPNSTGLRILGHYKTYSKTLAVDSWLEAGSWTFKPWADLGPVASWSFGAGPWWSHPFFRLLCPVAPQVLGHCVWRGSQWERCEDCELATNLVEVRLQEFHFQLQRFGCWFAFEHRFLLPQEYGVRSSWGHIVWHFQLAQDLHRSTRAGKWNEATFTHVIFCHCLSPKNAT